MSLTLEFQPEYRALLRTAKRLGFAVESWEGPSFRVRRSRRSTGPHGHCNVFEIALYVGRHTTWMAAYQILAHEVAHALTLDEREDHGPEFRRVLRALVRERWPKVGFWPEVHQPGASAAYLEDTRMLRALESAYPETRACVEHVHAPAIISLAV